MATPQDRLRTPNYQLPDDYYMDSPLSWEQGEEMEDRDPNEIRDDQEADLSSLANIERNKTINNNIFDMMGKATSPGTLITEDIMGLDTDGLVNQIAQFVSPTEAVSIAKMAVLGTLGDDWLRTLLKKLMGKKKPKSNLGNYNKYLDNAGENAASYSDDAVRKPLSLDEKIAELQRQQDELIRQQPPKVDMPQPEPEEEIELRSFVRKPYSDAEKLANKLSPKSDFDGWMSGQGSNALKDIRKDMYKTRAEMQEEELLKKAGGLREYKK